MVERGREVWTQRTEQSPGPRLATAAMYLKCSRAIRAGEEVVACGQHMRGTDIGRR